MAEMWQRFLDHLTLGIVVYAVIAGAGAMLAYIGVTSIKRVSLQDEAARVSGVRTLSWHERLQARLDQSGLTVRLFDLLRVGVAMGALAALPLAALGFLPLSVLAFVLGPVGYYQHLMRKRDALLRAFREALPDAIDDCADYLATNPSLLAALERLHESGPEPLRVIFARVRELARPGIPVQHALRVVAAERSEVFFRQFCLVLAAYGDSGSTSIRASLERISHGQRVQLGLQQRIQAQQAGVRLVASVYGFAPLVFLVFMRLFGGGVYPEFYATVIGQISQVFIAASGAVTFWLARRVASRGIYFDDVDRFQTVPERPAQPKPLKAGTAW
jgi:Flp pilus assembly protein TadB